MMPLLAGARKTSFVFNSVTHHLPHRFCVVNYVFRRLPILRAMLTPGIQSKDTNAVPHAIFFLAKNQK